MADDNERPVKQGKFYFWRNFFFGVCSTIFVCIGLTVSSSWALFRSAESGIKRNDKSIAVMETKLENISAAQQELKNNIKDEFKELKELIAK